MKRTITTAAFTLIELLVVISIIAILAGVGLPVYNNAVLQGKQTAAANSARQIGLALKMYAGDHDGSLPDGNEINSSNDAFRLLVPTYIDNEALFAVPGSKAGAKADNVVTPASRAVDRGENHWAYVAGLSSTSNSTWPIIADHSDGSGYYSEREGDLGGTWKGGKAIVVYADSSVKQIRLLGTGSRRYIPRLDDSDKNALQVREYMGDAVRLLEPAH